MFIFGLVYPWEKALELLQQPKSFMKESTAGDIGLAILPMDFS